MFRLLITALTLSVVTIGTAFAQDRAITQIAGDVYRFQNKFHYSVFIITDEGVVVTDPINAEAAAWLREEIGKLTDKPITHLIYSHSHGDHASGGVEFGAANIIVHENAPESIDGVTPSQRISDSTTIKVGSTSIELEPLGPGHGQDLMAMIIRPENIGFVVDAVSSKRLPYRDFPNANVDDWINQVKNIEALDFEILAGGHGAVGVKEDVKLAREYMEELREQVLAGLTSGKMVDELVSSIMLDKYSDWGSYEQWRGLNIEGMARHLKAIGAVQ